ncbi:F-box domain-containing protein [Diaporthe sp. PMI_573]|nr:F-box domain-containing protein [Diaporthaceae sp. PMI_573]
MLCQTAARTMVLLTQLPLEIVNHVLSFVDPEDLPRVNTTCQYLYHAVKDNNALFRAVYLHHLDAPPPEAQLNWIQEIQDLVKLKRLCASEKPERSDHLPFVYQTVTRLLQHATSRATRPRPSVTYGASQNVSILRECFSEESTVQSFLCRSFLFQRARAPVKNFVSPRQPPTEERQMSAKLHCLYGAPVLNFSRLRSSRTHPFAISKVYDIREYTTRTRWGPFMDAGPGPVGSEVNEDGQEGLPGDKVDWEKVEAIMIVLWHNMKTKGLDRLPVFSQFWGRPFAGCWPKSYVPEPRNRDIKDLELEDPYDVTGTWLRVVCFLDYNDFFAYNFPPHDDLPDHLPRHALDEVEATRLIVVKIRVTRIEPPGPEDGQSLPVVHFEGFSKSLDSSLDENANSGLTGSVRLTREGEVRWTSHSIFNGQERWRSESIQVGGIRSAKVVGNWFDKDYDPSGPVGPTAFWKLSDRHPGSRDEHITENDYRAIIDGLEDDVDLGPADDDEAGVLSVFQINSDDEEYEISEYEEDDGEEEGRHGPAEGVVDDTSSEGQQDSDGNAFVLAGVRSHGLDDK